MLQKLKLQVEIGKELNLTKWGSINISNNRRVSDFDRQCDAEIHIDRKILNAMGKSNPGPTGERPVFYHYTYDFPADKRRNNDTTT